MHSADRSTPVAEDADVVFVTELVSNVPARPSLPLGMLVADLLLRLVA